MMRDVAGDNRRAAPLGLERADLLVEGADLGTFHIVQNRHADGARNVVVRKLALREDVDDHAVVMPMPGGGAFDRR